jgi:hypothetical protein
MSEKLTTTNLAASITSIELCVVFSEGISCNRLAKASPTLKILDSTVTMVEISGRSKTRSKNQQVVTVPNCVGYWRLFGPDSSDRRDRTPNYLLAEPILASSVSSDTDEALSLM